MIATLHRHARGITQLPQVSIMHIMVLKPASADSYISSLLGAGDQPYLEGVIDVENGRGDDSGPHMSQTVSASDITRCAHKIADKRSKL